MNSPLEAPTRLITTHDENGKAVFFKAIPEKTQQKPIGKEAVFALGYTTSDFPADLDGDKDIESYRQFEAQPPGLVVNSGSVLRYVDIAPGTVSPMHRTVSLDYGIALEGDIELLLDSGEVRKMKAGDVAIQRGTMHAWKNAGSTWGRLIFVLQPCKPVTTADGTVLKEDYADMEGVRPSS